MPTLGISTLLSRAEADGTLERVANNIAAQFGTRARRYIGHELLPERRVEQNQYTEDRIRYRTVIANAGTRYSPVQKKGGALVGSFDVKLWESDIGSEFTSQDYDVFMRMLRNGATMDAMAALVNFLDTTVTRALIELDEAAIWQAIVDASVVRVGDNGFGETIAYSRAVANTAAIAGAWTNNANDPFNDIYAMTQVLVDGGYSVKRIITSSRAANIMARNSNVASRTNRITVNTSGQIIGINGRVSIADINQAMAADNLPPIETYDLQYRTSTGSTPFLKNTVMVFIGETDSTETVDFGDSTDREVLPNTLGYLAIGRAAGQPQPGRVVRSEHFEDKPPRIEAEGWETSGVVITEPGAIGVLTGI